MFFASVALIALALAALARRPLWSLLERRFHRTAILWLAVGLHLLFVPPSLSPLLAAAPLPGLPTVGGLLYTSSLVLLVVFAWFNRPIPGIPAIGLGLLMNALVIAANGGQMPVDPGRLAAKGELEGLLRAERAGHWSSFAVARENTHLSFLGDQLLVPRPFMDPVILSPGDLAIAVGIILFVFVRPSSTRRPSAAPPTIPG